MMNAVRLWLYFLSTIAHLKKCRNVGSVRYMSRARKSQTKQLHNAAVAVSLLMKVGMVSIMDLTIQQVAAMTIAILNPRKVISFHTMVMTSSNIFLIKSLILFYFILLVVQLISIVQPFLFFFFFFVFLSASNPNHPIFSKALRHRHFQEA